MSEDAIIVKNITKSFSFGKKSRFSKKIKLDDKGRSGKFKALDNISFTVKRGEILGIIGFNGSGKSTLLRVIASVYKPDEGKVVVNGRLSPLMQLGAGFQLDLNARDNIIMDGMLLGVSKSKMEKKVESVIEYAELEKFANMKLKHYSTGMRSRLAFATALQINPDIFLVDEIQAVGDKDFREKSYQSFLSFKKNKKTILHTTHNLDKLKEFSDKVLLLHEGKNIMLGDPEQVIEKYKQMKPSK